MYIQNATYKTIPTEGLTFPLEAGTVLTVNNITGIVPEKVAVAAPTGVLYLAVGGTIDLTSEANAGITFTDAELNALSGDFNFIPLAESGGGGESKVRYLAVYDEDADRCEINATFAEINATFESGSKIEIYEEYEGTEYTMGNVSSISRLTAPTLWLNFDNAGLNETTAIAPSAESKPTFETGRYGVEDIEFTLTGSTWACSHTLEELNAIGVGAPVYVDLPVAGLPNGSSKMMLAPVMHMSYGQGIACKYYTKEEPFTAVSNEKFDVQASVFQSTVNVYANKYSVTVTNTNLLA